MAKEFRALPLVIPLGKAWLWCRIVIPTSRYSVCLHSPLSAAWGWGLAGDPCSWQKGPTLGLTVCCCHLEILNNVIFELMFCTKSIGSAEHACDLSSKEIHGCPLVLAARSRVAFMVPHEHRIPQDPWLWQSVGKTPSKHKVSMSVTE